MLSLSVFLFVDWCLVVVYYIIYESEKRRAGEK